jgi:hypothetical protein
MANKKRSINPKTGQPWKFGEKNEKGQIYWGDKAAVGKDGRQLAQFYSPEVFKKRQAEKAPAPTMGMARQQVVGQAPLPTLAQLLGLA